MSETLESMVATIADEVFGPFPVQTAEENLTAIEDGIFELEQENARLRAAMPQLAVGQIIVQQSEMRRILSELAQLRAQVTALQAESTAQVNTTRLQKRVVDWVSSTFDEATQANTAERALRFVEEAIELGQAVGVPHAYIDRLADRIYSNPAGDAAKEVAGCGVTLFSIAGTLGINVLAVTSAEIERLESPEMRERARQRQDEKRAQLITADRGAR